MRMLTVRDFPGLLHLTNCDKTPPYLDTNIHESRKSGKTSIRLSGKKGSTTQYNTPSNLFMVSSTTGRARLNVCAPHGFEKIGSEIRRRVRILL